MKFNYFVVFIFSILFLHGCKFQDPFKTLRDLGNFSLERKVTFNIKISNKSEQPVNTTVYFPRYSNFFPMVKVVAKDVINNNETKTLTFTTDTLDVNGYDSIKGEVPTGIEFKINGKILIISKSGYSREGSGDVIIFDDTDLLSILESDNQIISN